MLAIEKSMRMPCSEQKRFFVARKGPASPAPRAGTGWLLFDFPVAVDDLQHHAGLRYITPMIARGPVDHAVRYDGAAHGLKCVAQRRTKFPGARIGFFEGDGNGFFQNQLGVITMAGKLIP